MEDGRRAFRVIAQDLGVPESTVRFRANRLLREGTLRIVAMAEPRQLGFEILGIVLVRVAPPARAQAARQLAALPEVQYLSSCAGRADFVAQIVCRDPEHLRRFLAEDLSTIDGILDSETLVELDVHKYKYTYAAVDDSARSA
jgi:Lrp/AsnC family transcriptional regulator for asnA, asnC and gidA